MTRPGNNSENHDELKVRILDAVGPCVIGQHPGHVVSILLSMVTAMAQISSDHTVESFVELTRRTWRETLEAAARVGNPQ